MKPVIEQIEDYLIRTTCKNAWVKDDKFDVYFRRSERYLDLKRDVTKDTNRTVCLDIANISAINPGQGFFRNELLAQLKKLSTKHQYPLYFENVHNKRFFKFLLKRGFKRQEDQISCLWTPSDEDITIWCNDYCHPIVPPLVLRGIRKHSIGVWALGKDDLFDCGFQHEDLHKFGLEFLNKGIPFFKLEPI